MLTTPSIRVEKLLSSVDATGHEIRLVCMHMYVCMYVCMYVYICLHMYVCMNYRSLLVLIIVLLLCIQQCTAAQLEDTSHVSDQQGDHHTRPNRPGILRQKRFELCMYVCMYVCIECICIPT